MEYWYLRGGKKGGELVGLGSFKRPIPRRAIEGKNDKICSGTFGKRAMVSKVEGPLWDSKKRKKGNQGKEREAS